MESITKELIEQLEGFTEGMRRYWKDTYQEETPDLSQVIEAEELIKKARAMEEHSNENAVLPIHSVRLSLPFNDLYKALDDKRMKTHVNSESVWHLYRKQTAEHLLDNYDIYGKGNEA